MADILLSWSLDYSPNPSFSADSISIWCTFHQMRLRSPVFMFCKIRLKFFWATKNFSSDFVLPLSILFCRSDQFAACRARICKQNLMMAIDSSSIILSPNLSLISQLRYLQRRSTLIIQPTFWLSHRRLASRGSQFSFSTFLQNFYLKVITSMLILIKFFDSFSNFIKRF